VNRTNRVALSSALAGALILALAPKPIMAAPGKCQLAQLAEIAVSPDGRVPLIEASINNQPVKMLIDTGAARSAIWVETAKKLGLDTVESGVTFNGAGGRTSSRLATVRQFGLGRFTVRDLTLYVLETGTPTEEVAGSVGEDFLSRLDVEFDLPKKAMRLFETKNCVGDQVVYWAQSYAMAKLVHPVGEPSNWLLANVGLNGHEVLGMFDTGASVTLVNARAAYRLGKTARENENPSAQMHGVGGPAATSLSAASFAVITIGQESIQNVTLTVGDLFKHERAEQTGSYVARADFDEPDLIVGADFFSAHRVFVANSQAKVYFTYSGGPIFVSPPPRAATQAPASR
jgi:clan AA aspartic protease (TIGR02281 family)